MSDDQKRTYQIFNREGKRINVTVPMDEHGEIETRDDDELEKYIGYRFREIREINETITKLEEKANRLEGVLAAASMEQRRRKMERTKK
jgi:predicted SPOUT superfamily RNA methylase MTH1